LAKLTKKGELQSRINRKNEEIDLLKVGLSGIAKRYDSVQYTISTKSMFLLKMLIAIIRIKFTNEKKGMVKMYKI